MHWVPTNVIISDFFMRVISHRPESQVSPPTVHFRDPTLIDRSEKEVLVNLMLIFPLASPEYCVV